MSALSCPQCCDEKPSSEFHKNRARANGYERLCKVCNNARQREKYRTDPEHRAKTLARTRQYHLDNPEWSKERLRAHHERNAEERYARHVERGKDPKVRAQRRASARLSEQRRRAVKAGAVLASVSKTDLDNILERHSHQCAICQRGFNGVDVVLHWDHIRPLARGGQHRAENLQPLCSSCNVRKSAVWPLSAERLAHIKNSVLEDFQPLTVS